MLETVQVASLRRGRIIPLAFAVCVLLLAGCAKPKPPPISLTRPPVVVQATGTLVGTLYLVAGEIEIHAEPITPAMQRELRIAVPRREYTAWLVTMHNRSSRPILLNPRFDEWSAVTTGGAKVAATPATRLRLKWFMDSISPAAVRVISYPERAERGQKIQFPVYVATEGKAKLASMRFWSRDVEDDVRLVDPGLLPIPLPLAGQARIEALTGSAEVIVGQDQVATDLHVGSVIRAGDVVVLEDDSVLVVFDEWGTGDSYEIKGPDIFRVVPRPES